MAREADEVGLRTLKSTARFLGISLSQVYRLGQDGQITLVKIGRRQTRATQASLDAYIERAERMVPTRKRPEKEVQKDQERNDE